MRPTAQLRGDVLERHMLMTERALSDSLLADDAMFQRVAPEARSALVDAVLWEGRACAESVSLDLGTDPWAIAQRLGVAVVESDADASVGSVVLFAEYTRRPPTITLYRTAIERTNRYLAAPRERAVFNLEDCKPVFLAHELYHHLARSAPRPPFSRTYRVTLLQLGRWRWTSRIASLEEIAAGAFAQTLLGLKFHSRLIELLWVQQKDGGEQ
jgi:hypothetical protein